MRWSPSVVARLPLARTVALCGMLLATSGACGSSYTEEPGARGGVIDFPVAVLSASQNDVTTTELYLADESGNSTRMLPTFTGAKWQVRWSGDGRRLAIAGNTLGATSNAVGSTSDVWVLNADGTGLQRITTDGASGFPNWLADGRLLYVSAPPQGGLQWFAVPASGGLPVPVTLRNGQPLYAPDWSRTGPRMAFNDQRTVFTADADGTGEHPVATGALPRWSPTGDRIAYLGLVNGIASLLVIPAAGIPAGSAATPTIAAPDLTQFVGGFAWSQDGTRIAWIRRTATGVEAVVSPADGSRAPSPLVQRSSVVVAYDVDVDWRPAVAK